MSPEAPLDRVLDSFAWVEYFRGSPGGRTAAEALESSLCGTPLVVVAELRDKYVREGVPGWREDFEFLREATTLLPESEGIAVRAGETKNRMRGEGRSGFGLIDAIVLETAREVGAILVTGDPHFRGLRGVLFLE